nr:hypothetical protein [Tanacetum cinerariifolium]
MAANEKQEWVKVTRRKERSNQGFRQGERRDSSNIHQSRKGPSDFDKVMRDKAISFFFTNFPDNWYSRALWKMFSRYGNVVDVYITFKKTKRDTRFGFVRFVNIGDISRFEARLKGIMIGNTSFIINRAKFIKGESKGLVSSDFPPIRPGLFIKPVSVNTNKGSSFKDAVTGGKMISWAIGTNYIHVDEDKNIKSKLERSWIGKAKNFHVPQNA